MAHEILGEARMPAIRTHLADGPTYTPGQAPVDNAGKVFKLSSNESAVGASPAAIAALRDLAAEQHLYPDADGAALAKLLAQKHGLDAGRIVTAPGSEALISWLIQAFCEAGDEVLHSAHAFQAYRIRAISNGAVPVSAPEIDLRTSIDGLLDRVTPRTRIVFVSNPNNPTGTHLAYPELLRFRQRLRTDVLLVVDEAYFEYVNRPDYASALSLVNDATPNVVVTRTFSKFFGLAGLRVGWAYLPSQFAGAVGKLRGPFAVSRLALAAAAAALGDQAHQARARAHNDQWRAWLQDQLRDLGLRTTASEGNFVLFEVPGGQDAAAALHRALAAEGFLTRIADQNGLPGWIRVTVGSEPAMTGFVAVLRRLQIARSLRPTDRPTPVQKARP